MFEGTAEFSSCDALKKQLSDNLATYQESIDVEFPPDQPQNARSHAVFLVIVCRGYYQAIGFLNASMTFYELLSMAGLQATEAWGNEMLTFTMSIFETTHRVHTITSEGAAYTMMFGIMRATELLDEYSKAEWVKHPSVSADMVLASLQKDGKGKSVVAGTVAEHTTKLASLFDSAASLKASCKSVQEELKALKNKNPNLNM